MRQAVLTRLRSRALALKNPTSAAATCALQPGKEDGFGCHQCEGLGECPLTQAALLNRIPRDGYGSGGRGEPAK
jgi:hypothetical protein